jgi:hypothetical protein
MAGVLFRSFAIVGPKVREAICNNFLNVSLFMEDVSIVFICHDSLVSTDLQGMHDSSAGFVFLIPGCR